MYAKMRIRYNVLAAVNFDRCSYNTAADDITA